MRKIILRDSLATFLLLAASLALGLIANECCKSPLPLAYSSPETRLSDAVADMGASNLPKVVFGADVDEKEMLKISANQSALILDARPRVYFELEHIPSALSLPRDNFKQSYQTLQKNMFSYRNRPIVIYCSDNDCPDGRIVGETLRKLGYQNVRLFRGGWSEWANAPVSTDQGCGCGS